MRILPNTWLARLYPQLQSATRVNSIHHQAIRELGEGLVPEAVSEPDGVIEAIRWEGHSFVVGVQWHPEFMDPKDPTLIDGRPNERPPMMSPAAGSRSSSRTIVATDSRHTTGTRSTSIRAGPAAAPSSCRAASHEGFTPRPANGSKPVSRMRIRATILPPCPTNVTPSPSSFATSRSFGASIGSTSRGFSARSRRCA